MDKCAPRVARRPICCEVKGLALIRLAGRVPIVLHEAVYLHCTISGHTISCPIGFRLIRFMATFSEWSATRCGG